MTAAWMAQMARNVSMADDGFLKPGHYLLHDRDSKFTEEFDEILRGGGVKPVKLPARSPNLNAFAERWVLSVKSECLSKVILFGEASFRRALSDFCTHYHGERPHQGKGHVILFPEATGEQARDGPIRCRERIEWTAQVLSPGCRMSFLTARDRSCSQLQPPQP